MLVAMDASESPTISSFVIRFVIDPGNTSSYRGEIRHIQTQEEIHFHLWEEAEAFIRRFVPLEDKKRDLL